MTFLRAMVAVAGLGVATVGLTAEPAAGQTPGRCPAGYTKQVDQVGPEDRCYKLVEISCGPGGAVKIDSMGYADVCPPAAAAGTASSAAPCPDGFSQIYRQGRDACESSKPPTCASGRTLHVQPGADLCR